MGDTIPVTIACDPTNFCGGFSERGALSLQFTVEATVPLWDIKESCLWFEIAYKAGRVLCRIDALCFMNSLGVKSPSGTACRAAFEAAKPRIHGLALTQAEAGHLNPHPSKLRRFVWLTDKDFAA
jgi:hypothetical protein